MLRHSAFHIVLIYRWLLNRSYPTHHHATKRIPHPHIIGYTLRCAVGIAYDSSHISHRWLPPALSPSPPLRPLPPLPMQCQCSRHALLAMPWGDAPPPLDRIQSLWAGGRGGGQPEPLLAKESLGEGRKSASFRKRTLMRGRGGPNQTGPQHRSASGVLFPLFRRKGPVGEPPTFTHAESGGGGGYCESCPFLPPLSPPPPPSVLQNID